MSFRAPDQTFEEVYSNVMAPVGRGSVRANLLMLFLVPTGEFQKHLNTLANIAKLLHHEEFRDGLWRRFM